MSIQPPSSAAANVREGESVPLSLTPNAASDPAFDQRWAAWHARGAEHDRAAGRRMIVAAPVLVVMAGLAAFFLVR